MYAVEKTSRGLATAPIKPVKNIGLSKLAIRILRHLVVTPDHPRNIAKKFGEHEQKIYYHVRQLDKMGFIEIESKKYLGGTVANVYKSSSSGFVLMIDKTKIMFYSNNFHTFIIYLYSTFNSINKSFKFRKSLPQIIRSCFCAFSESLRFAKLYSEEGEVHKRNFCAVFK